MKILIISSFFPPQNSIASLRPYSWAKYWSRSGHDVTVLTVPKKIDSSNIDLSFDRFQVCEVEVPLVVFFNKTASTKSLDEKFLNKNEGKDNKYFDKIIKSIRERRRMIQAKYGIFYGCRMPDALDFFWKRRALQILDKQKWDLVVSTAGPYSVHAPAYYLKKKGLAKFWIADWRDLWTDNHMYPGLSGFRIIERFLEKKWCLCADAITTVSEPLADNLRQKYGNKVSVIFNGFDEDDYSSLPDARAFPDDGIIRIVYTGTIYPKLQDPSPLFRAIFELDRAGLVNPTKLQVLFCGSNANLNEMAENMGISAYVRYLGFLPRMQALNMQRDASALLLLEVENSKAKGILTGKLFEYLFAGPPIIAIGVSSNSGIGELLKITDSGMAFGNDVSAIKSFIIELINGKIKNKGKKQEILKYSRKEQARLMLELVTRSPVSE